MSGDLLREVSGLTRMRLGMLHHTSLLVLMWPMSAATPVEKCLSNCMYFCDAIEAYRELDGYRRERAW
jgi:hypothetical protein